MDIIELPGLPFPAMPPSVRVLLVLAKYASSMTLVAGLVGVAIVCGLAAGATVFGWGPLPTLSGTTLSIGATLVRIVGDVRVA